MTINIDTSCGNRINGHNHNKMKIIVCTIFHSSEISDYNIISVLAAYDLSIIICENHVLRDNFKHYNKN